MLHSEDNVEGSAQGEQAKQRIALERELNALKVRARDIADIVSSVATELGEEEGGDPEGAALERVEALRFCVGELQRPYTGGRPHATHARGSVRRERDVMRAVCERQKRARTARRRAGSAEVGTEVQSRVVHQELRGSAAHAGAANAVDATVVPSERNVLSETTTNHLPNGADATKYYSLAELEVLASFGPGRAANDENAA